MLPDSFLDWWFSPWTYSSTAGTSLPMASDLLGQRDGYRLWCAGVGVTFALPARFDPAWQIAAITDREALLTTARLFGGLIAARRQDNNVLGQLGIADRKWCMGVALVQPLGEYASMLVSSHDTVEILGLTGLACRLEQSFPGMWPRLRLLLSLEQGHRVNTLLEMAPDRGTIGETSAQRSLRCWRLCRRRAEDFIDVRNT
ncbi:MAG: hypothetical protein V7642_5279 [Burkholderiales bacterium]|jgi:hypothetical protein